MSRALRHKVLPGLVLTSLVIVLSALTIFGPLHFNLHNPPVLGVPPTLDPGLNLDASRQIIVALTVVTLLVALLVSHFRERTPTALALILDILPLVWMFFFVWSLVHNVSELIPARKHPLFNRNALASAGLLAFVAALIPRRARGVGVGSLGLFLSVLAICDILHMRIFGNVIPVGSHGSFTQLWDVRGSIASLFEKRDGWILFYVTTAATMIACWRVKSIPVLRVLPAAVYFAPIILLSYFIKPIRQDVTDFLDSKWAKEVLNREDQVWNAGFFEAHVREISLNLKNSLAMKKPTADELAQVADYYRDEHAAHATYSRPSFGRDKGKNVLVIQVEAFEE